jgi:hypothetical protein
MIHKAGSEHSDREAGGQPPASAASALSQTPGFPFESCRLALAVAFLLLGFGIAAAAPAVTLAPATGPPTTTITVSGTGFNIIQAVDIYFDTTDACLSVSDAAGAFSCTIKAPAGAQPQNHWITAIGRKDGSAAQKAFTVRTDWAQFHGMNAKHTGFNPYENTIDTSNVRNLDILWTAPLGPFAPSSAPVVVGGRVYIGGGDGKLYSFSTKTGAAVAGWPKTLSGTAVGNSSPAVGGNIVYIATSVPDRKLCAFNAVSGAAIAGFPVTLGIGGTSTPSPTPLWRQCLSRLGRRKDLRLQGRDDLSTLRFSNDRRLRRIPLCNRVGRQWPHFRGFLGS